VTPATVQLALQVAARPFGPGRPDAPALRWGLLFAALHDGDDEYVEAIELIYEGYLCHYREPRTVVPASLGDALLAGDYLYARGLRTVAARGDADAVGLLARLMAACSFLRSCGASFGVDDALWAYTTAALAALRHGLEPAAAECAYDEADAVMADGRAEAVVEVLGAAAPRLALSDDAPLRGALNAARDEVVPVRAGEAGA
jgi:hypothetical protein